MGPGWPSYSGTSSESQRAAGKHGIAFPVGENSPRRGKDYPRALCFIAGNPIIYTADPPIAPSLVSGRNRMRRRSLFAVAFLLGICAFLAAKLGATQETKEGTIPPASKSRSSLSPAAPPRFLPGVQPGGSVLLPNQWSLRPAGKQVVIGDLPVNVALHPGGRWLAVLHAGYGEHEVMIVDLQREK